MIKQIFFTSLLSLIFISCGNDMEVKIKGFNVVGTAEDLEDGRAPIDPAMNDGKFELSWRVDDDGTFGYTAKFYLSVNANLDKSNDILFEFADCNAFGPCDHDDQTDEECYFTNDTVMFCGDEDDASKYDVGEIADSLPMDAYIIIEACTTFDCDTQAHPIRLQ